MADFDDFGRGYFGLCRGYFGVKTVVKITTVLQFEDLLEVFAGGGVGVLGEVFRGAGGDDLTAVLTAFGAHVDNPIGGFDDVEVMLDDDHGVAAVDEFTKDFEQTADIVGVEAGGRLVEDIEGLAGTAASELSGELDALGFAAGEGGGRLAELDVAEADFLDGFELREDGGDVGKEFYGFVDSHVKNLGDVLPFILDLEGFVVVAAAVASGAGDVDVGEEVHFDFVDTVALAGFAASTLNIETEAAGFITAKFSFGLMSEKFADLIEDTGISRDVGTRGAANRGLVDDDTLVEMLDAVDALVEAGNGLGAVEASKELVREDFVDEGGFPGAGDAGDDGHDAKWELDGDIFQVVLTGADND